MNIIDACKADLEKLLGFPVTIKVIQYNGNGWNEMKMEDLYFIKDERNPLQFLVGMKNPPEPTRENGWYNGWVSKFNLQQLPGCCGVLLSTGSSVCGKYQGKGVATRLNAFRRAIAHHEGYSLMLCTDVASNTPQSKVLARNGWKNVHTFVNARTHNTLNISVAEILRPHTFSYVATGRESTVRVFGDFTENHGGAWKYGHLMALRDGVWTTKVFLPVGVPFQYKFQINGSEWILDPNNPNVMDNGMGGFNSFVDSDP